MENDLSCNVRKCQKKLTAFAWVGLYINNVLLRRNKSRHILGLKLVPGISLDAADHDLIDFFLVLDLTLWNDLSKNPYNSNLRKIKFFLENLKNTTGLKTTKSTLGDQ